MKYSLLGCTVIWDLTLALYVFILLRRTEWASCSTSLGSDVIAGIYCLSALTLMSLVIGVIAGKLNMRAGLPLIGLGVLVISIFFLLNISGHVRLYHK